MCRCPGILFISWIRSLRSVCLQPAGVRPWSSLLPVAGASVPLRFFFSADCSSIVCDRSSCFSFLPSEVSLSLRFLIPTDRSPIECPVQSCHSSLPFEAIWLWSFSFRLRILFLSPIVHVSRTVGRRLCVVEGIVPLPPSHRLQFVPLTFDPVSLPPPVVGVHDRWRCALSINCSHVTLIVEWPLRTFSRNPGRQKRRRKSPAAPPLNLTNIYNSVYLINSSSRYLGSVHI